MMSRCPTMLRRLSDLPLHPPRFPSSLPIDPATPDPHNLPPQETLHQNRAVPGCASYVHPTPQPSPELIAVSPAAVQLLELDPAEVEKREFLEIVAGNRVLEGTTPWAQNYGGHQFGVWAGQLGDGRAISLFETKTSSGEIYELQLKGAGKTPYSRWFTDGWAVLRSSIREFLGSEYLAALKVPTTRALSLVKTSRVVKRERNEPGAVVCRIGPSFVRFGTFEIFHQRGDRDTLRQLAEFTCRELFSISEHEKQQQHDTIVPAADQETGKPVADSKEGNGNRFWQMFRESAYRTARMVARWQATGFCHGVLNTDNMHVLGVTLDYGPFAFMEAFDPKFICNHSDDGGRYSYEAQPQICAWNLFKFGTTLAELIGAGNMVDSPSQPSDEQLKIYREKGKSSVVQFLNDEFGNAFLREYTTFMREKLGFSEQLEDDLSRVIEPLLSVLYRHDLDYHRFFRSLSSFDATGEEDIPQDGEVVTRLIGGCSPTGFGFEDQRVQSQKDSVLRRDVANWLELYRARLQVEGQFAAREQKGLRASGMNKANPSFVLRNWVAQEVIDAAEQGDYAPLKVCLEMCLEPFKEPDEYPDGGRRFLEKTPRWGQGLICSCSS
ncbi:uncharacterized protein VTP21DRAFT_2959 [Calcarisporiella thermophila]|uniref:uncharacterized protein n=1 Tax=Calcarisporiella thermophila TaxID=911321 RepID=UPI00374337BF